MRHDISIGAETETTEDPPPDPRFLNNIRDTEMYWVFWIIGGMKVVGRVTTFLWTPQSVPITLTVQPDRGSAVEIPWSSIQKIQPGKGK